MVKEKFNFNGKLYNSFDEVKESFPAFEILNKSKLIIYQDLLEKCTCPGHTSRLVIDFHELLSYEPCCENFNKGVMDKYKL